jgi:hypothetical protein
MSEPGHKERFDALLAASVRSGSHCVLFTVETSGASIIHCDALSGTWYDPTVCGQIIRPPFMFDDHREAHEAEWPTEKLEARWREILEKKPAR